MSSSQPHPSLGLSVTSEQRDRAEALLKDAYADGRIDELEFDNRIGEVLAAATRKDLNEAFYGLVEVPTPSAGPETPTAQPSVSPPALGQQSGRGAAGFAHFSVFLLWLIGPGMTFAVSPAGSYARREAAKAFNFQLVSAIVLVPLYIIAGINGFEVVDWLLSLIGTGWLILTIVGGVKAVKGEDWRNPVKSAVKLEVLPER